MTNNDGPWRTLTKTLLSLPLRFKISIPYLIAASLLAGLATYLVGRSFVQTLEERFRSQLEEASFRAFEEVIAVEADQLQILRTLSFTLGVSEAVAAADTGALTELIYPHVVNYQLYFVEILDAAGQPLTTWHRVGDSTTYRPDEVTEYQDWTSAAQVLAGIQDDLGDKFSQIVAAPWGLTLYTAGPIQTEAGLQGVLLVGTPISTILPDLALLSLANMTLYDAHGSPVFSTLNIVGIEPLSTAHMANLPGISEELQTRAIQSNQRQYIEAFETLYLRGEPTQWILGISLSEALVRDAQGASTWQLVTIFTVGFFALIGLGVLVAQLIASPVFRLVDATEKVGGGDFDVEVSVQANDEIGTLTKGFNEMVVGLQHREYIREMFGRMVSEDVSEAILKNELDLGGEDREVTALFTDVRGFTSMSEKNRPVEIIALLNEFFNIVTAATHKYQGAVNHFGGDSVLAIFGAPIRRPLAETIRSAILAAGEIQIGVIQLNARRISEGQEPIQFGIGINSGAVVAGTIGSEDRFTYTVIGDVVNVAARLQGVSREFPRTPILIPKDPLDFIPDLDVGFQFLGDHALKGKGKPVSTYAIIGATDFIPADFDVFADHGSHPLEALIICNLYEVGYKPEVIAAATLIPLAEIQEILQIAAENQDQITPVLAAGFGSAEAGEIQNA